jgi:hypothetical protein
VFGEIVGGELKLKFIPFVLLGTSGYDYLPAAEVPLVRADSTIWNTVIGRDVLMMEHGWANMWQRVPMTGPMGSELEHKGYDVRRRLMGLVVCRKMDRSRHLQRSTMV